MKEELVEQVCVYIHNSDSDDFSVEWGKQPSKYRTSLRNRVRAVLTAAEKAGNVFIPWAEYTALSLSAEQTSWQTIETAPKDGSNILAWADKWGGFHIVAWNEDEGCWCEGTWCYKTPPTHWMPVDPPS